VQHDHREGGGDEVDQRLQRVESRPAEPVSRQATVFSAILASAAATDR
jgi:hypothetical protein